MSSSGELIRHFYMLVKLFLPSVCFRIYCLGMEMDDTSELGNVEVYMVILLSYGFGRLLYYMGLTAVVLRMCW